VLEPGCGSGNFLAFAPDGAQVTGIELDPVTAGIADLLYPGAEVRAESFADSRDGEGRYDLAIGNVPSGNMEGYAKPSVLLVSRGVSSLTV
jgi:SAM-dependent methyltransferase